MSVPSFTIDTDRYARCIEVSKRIRWDIDTDVIRGRGFGAGEKFLPDGLSLVDRMPMLDEGEKRFMSRVQGRTYANIFGLVERFINAKVLEVSRDHWLGDQTALEALVRFSEEELKHQALFRRIEQLAAEQMPPGYAFMPDPDDVADAVLGKSTWSVLALTCHIELFTQAHYRESIEPDPELSPLFRDVFLYHWKEESQHAVMDELEWRREDARISPAERDRAVDDLIELVGAVNGILELQAESDSAYFVANLDRRLGGEAIGDLQRSLLDAYRWQYIVSGVRHPRFSALLGELTNEAQAARISAALAPLL